MGLFSWFHNKVAPGLVKVLDFVSGGAITRQDELRKAKQEAKVQEQQLKESLAKSWSDTERNAAMAARSAELEVEAGADQARAGAIDKFQAESAAMDAAGRSGIAEGSPYMALQSSINEADRSLRSMFTQFSESIAMGGEGTAISIENARFNQKVGYQNLSSLQDDIADMEEQDTGLNMALDFFGGFASTVASVYSLGTTLVAGAKMAGMDLGWMTGGDSPNSFLKTMGVGAELKYASLTGDKSFFDTYQPKKIDPGKDFEQFQSKMALGWQNVSNGTSGVPLNGGAEQVMFPEFDLTPTKGLVDPFSPISGMIPAIKPESGYARRYGTNPINMYGFAVPRR